MARPLVFVTDNQITADSGHKPRFRRRRGACESCKRRKVRCNGTNPCNQCQKSSLECLYKSSGWRINDDDPDRCPSESPLPLTRASLTPPQTAAPSSPCSGMDYTASMEEASRTDGADAHNSLIDFTGTEYTTNTDSAEISQQWQDWLSDNSLPFGNDTLLTGTSDDHSTDWLDPQLVHPDDTTAIMQDLSAEDSLQSSGRVPDLFNFLPWNSELDINKTRNDQIAACIQKLRSQKPFTLCDESPDTLSTDNILGHRSMYQAKFTSECLDACYAEPDGYIITQRYIYKEQRSNAFRIRVLLGRGSMDLVTEEVSKYALAVDTETSALFHSLMALGCHFLNLKQSQQRIGKDKYPVMKFFKDATSTRQRLRDTPTLRGLQALLTMAYFSIRVGDDLTSSLLADATFCVQALHLHNTSAIENKHESPLEQEMAKRVLWFLYSLEKPRCLTEGLFPLIHDDFIDHDPPVSATCSPHGADWFAINTQYARICSCIARDQPRRKLGHTQARFQQDQPSEPSSRSVIQWLESLLNAWRDDLPFASDSNTTQSNEFAALTCSEKRLRIKCLNQYWFAIIATHSVQARSAAIGGGGGDVESSRGKCLEAAREILKNSHHITSTDILYDISHYYFITVATRVIMAAAIPTPFVHHKTDERSQNTIKTSSKDIKDGGSILSYIGIAIGLFSRLSLDMDVPVDEVTELGKFRRQMIKHK